MIVRTEKSGFPGRCPVGGAFIYQSSIWTVKGVCLVPGHEGTREVCLIVTEQSPEDLDSVEARKP